MMKVQDVTALRVTGHGTRATLGIQSRFVFDIKSLLP
jgi:hypothetical protein